jgi:segregation and condensation protein A
MTRDTAFNVVLEVYNGPFDLLLKAIDDGQLDVCNISLTKITAAYFEYWRRETPALVLASDFLFMAAYLLELKSKALLPTREIIGDDAQLENIEESLINHIHEYQVFKDMAQTLKQRKELFERAYGRHEGEAQEKQFELVDVDLRDLVMAFKRVYDDAAKREEIVPIAAEEVTLEQRIEEVKAVIFGRTEGVPFIDIFLRKSKLEIVVTFLAVLELTKQSLLRLAQDRRYGTILIFDRKVYDERYGRRDTDNGSGGVPDDSEPGAGAGNFGDTAGGGDLNSEPGGAVTSQPAVQS